MTTRSYYNLRNRANAGPANQPIVRTEDIVRPGSAPIVDSRGLTFALINSPIPGPTVALYSDIVASRPPSPREETEARLLAISPEDVRDEQVETGHLDDRSLAYITTDRINENLTSNERTSAPRDSEDGQWTTVRRRRARSLSSLGAREMNQPGNYERRNLTKEQVQVVQTATNELTDAQMKNYQRRYKVMNNDYSPSRGEGPSEPKGKGIDPREWGNVSIDSDEYDVDAQKAAFDSLSKKKLGPSRRKEKRSSKLKTHRTHDHVSRMVRPAESRPAAQIAKNSYLGAALQNVKRREEESQRRQTPLQPSDPDSPSSDSETSMSGSGSNSEDRGSSSSEDTPHQRRRENRHGRNRPRRRISSRSSHSSRTNIKPIPPLEYDGRADARAYHRFVRESEAYLRDGKVHGRRRVFLLSYYLTGRAYDFYTQKVAINEEQWDLQDFYSELFNYCFPVDYRMQMRKTLARCHQNERSIAEFTHELSELFNMIGDVPERDKVLKFWNGARPVIQKGLWRDNLNPEISSWDQVVAQAEIIEISENVAERRDRKTPAQHPQVSSSNARGESRSKNRNPEGAVRSVSFDTRSRNRPRSENRFRAKTPNKTAEQQDKSSYPRENSSSSRGRSGYPGKSNTPRHRTSESRNTPRLSDKERSEMLAAGLCFTCKQPGHLSRNCPTTSSVKSRGSRPPGLASFNIEPTMIEHETDDPVEVLDSLPLGALAFGDVELSDLNPSNKWMELTAPVLLELIDEWRKHYPRWKETGVWA